MRGNNGSVTQLYNPANLIYLPGSDEVAVVDYDTTAPNAGKMPSLRARRTATRAIDQWTQRITVGFSGFNTSSHRLVSFPLNARGDADPVQVVSGSGLSLGSLGAPFAAPGDAIRVKGFEN